MSFLTEVSSGVVNGGIRMAIAACEGVGKTTFGLSAPNVLLIPFESGLPFGANPAKTPLITTHNDTIAVLDEITTSAQKGTFKYKTLLLDSSTKIEELIHTHVLQSDSSWTKNNSKGLTMESALGGYGKAYLRANELFSEILTRCTNLALYGGINIIFTCHVFAGRVIDPTIGEYRQWELLLHSPKNDKNYGKREMMMQWADIIGFLHEPIFISDSAIGMSANKGRMLGVERTPGYVAKNRLNLKGEIAIGKEQCWNYLADAIFKSTGVDVYSR